MSLEHTPPEVRALYQRLAEVLNATDAEGRRWGDAKYGVYAFFDYDGEPIYVGQTREKLRTRIRRHLTNQRTDAVAMFVLDPYEVHAVQVWPLWHLETMPLEIDRKAWMDRAEWTVYAAAINASRFGAVLNEGTIVAREPVELPPSYTGVIAPTGWQERNQHPDVRVLRRAQTFWQLAKVAAERDVSMGLRRTLLVQAARLHHLVQERLEHLTDAGVVDEPDPNPQE